MYICLYVCVCMCYVVLVRHTTPVRNSGCIIFNAPQSFEAGYHCGCSARSYHPARQVAAVPHPHIMPCMGGRRGNVCNCPACSCAQLTSPACVDILARTIHDVNAALLAGKCVLYVHIQGSGVRHPPNNIFTPPTSSIIGLRVRLAPVRVLQKGFFCEQQRIIVIFR
jgi:hypothetical protein